MPNRILREGVLTSDRVDELSWQGEVFYRRLMSVVDDFGRFHARPALLRAACFPLRLDRVSDSDVGKWLRETEKAGLVRAYQVEGKSYLELRDFRQQVRAKESRFPPAPSKRVADATHAHSARASPAHVDVDVDGGEDVSEDGGATPTRVREKPRRAAQAPLALAPWVPAADWGDFDAMRNAKSGKAWTPRAKELALATLGKLRDAGHEPGAVLRQSVECGWSGLFPLREAQPPPAARESGRERARRNMDEICGVSHGNGATVSGTAERVDPGAVPALPGDVRGEDGEPLGRRVA